MSKKYFHNERSALKANREDRNGRLLKAFRRVNEDDVDLIGGALVELASSRDIPEMKPARLGLQVFVFDPHLMERNVNKALIAGYRIGRVITEIENQNKFSDEGYEVELSGFRLLGKNRKTILANVKSERLTAEREAFYRILGEQGIKGFSNDGKRSGRRHHETPTLSIGTFKEPISRANENSIIDAVDTAMDVQFGVQSGALPSVALGELEIHAYKLK